MEQTIISSHKTTLAFSIKHLLKANGFTCIIFITFLFIFFGCLPTPRSVYDFDDGTTQGWHIDGAVTDDKGKKYTPILFTEAHFEAAQYPNNFPGGDPLNDKKGCLLINGFQMNPWVQISGFPVNSEFWEISVYYTGLDANSSTIWQGIKGVSISIGDNYGALPGHIFANIGVRTRIGGKDKIIRELDKNGKLLFHPVNHQTTWKWSNIDATLNIPANEQVYMVFIEIRGDWKNFHAYEGSIMVDQIQPIK